MRLARLSYRTCGEVQSRLRLQVTLVDLHSILFACVQEKRGHVTRSSNVPARCKFHVQATWKFVEDAYGEGLKIAQCRYKSFWFSGCGFGGCGMVSRTLGVRQERFVELPAIS